VDFYRWRLNGGAWSAESAAAAPLTLSCATPGTQTLELLARPAHGDYPADSEALRVSWTVAADAPVVALLETPSYPSPERAARFRVGGADVATYRWALGAGYIHPSAPVAQSFTLSNLNAGVYEVRIFPNLPDGLHTNAGYAAFQWTNAPLYGYACASAAPIRAMPAAALESATNFTWDGRDAAGVQALPGWYTARLSVSNALGQLLWKKAYIQIEEIGAEEREIAAADRGAQRLHGRGDWVVWTDRSGAQWQIWARNVAANGAPFALAPAAGTQDNPFTDGRYVVWQGRQADSTWAVYWADLLNTNAGAHALSELPDVDEVNPSIAWPWAVWQARNVRVAGAPYQLFAKNLATGLTRAVSPSTQDQLDPRVDADRVVWQDWRDAAPGEIYFQDLESGAERRITANPAGQYHPALSGSMIVWEDNRNGQLDLYAHDLRDGRETRLTETPYDETSPVIQGEWVFYVENSLGPGRENLRLMHLASRRTAPLTRGESQKRCPVLLARQTAWLDASAAGARVVAGALPALRGVYAERNAVPVTEAMLTQAATAFNLLERWQNDAPVAEVATYDQLWPETVMRRAWRGDDGALHGDNFTLRAGMFVWLGFDRAQLIDLGPAEETPLTLATGVSALTYSGFPVGYSAFRMLRQIGLDHVNAVRMHDAASGRWLIARVENGRLVGADFPIPRAAVILIDMQTAVANWTPQ
jgi:beta propeller repeat protein